jgi:DNA replication factor GINS
VYDELYEAWRKEKESAEIQTLPKDFYAKLAFYVKKIGEESRMLDEKTTRARLLLRESQNVKKIVKELILLRYEKTVKKMITAENLRTESLTEEEEKIFGELGPSVESFHALLKNVLAGRSLRAEGGEKPRKTVLRFLRDIPAIIGADMKPYGPFKPEDVASLPYENAKILIKQGVAVEVEMKYGGSP